MSKHFLRQVKTSDAVRVEREMVKQKQRIHPRPQSVKSLSGVSLSG